MRLHLVGNAHIDPVWLWRWQDGFAEVKATFRSALDRMKEYPEFVFTCACTQYYRWIEENEPSLFEEIRQRVAQGRWVLVGGWIIQPDCNLPSGESFARQSLLGQGYFASRFGQIATVGYNVDSFGHNAGLPQILALSGMPRYVMMRPQETEMGLPGNLFQWQGADGTVIPAFRIPINYASWFEAEPLSAKLDAMMKTTTEQNTPIMGFYGVGNHGGGPTIAHIETILAYQERFGRESLPFSSPPAFFDEVAREGRQLPVVVGELQHHASGCYSAHLYTKASNRKAEARLVLAEKFAVLARNLLGASYPLDRMNDAWERALFNQFHDVAGGCCVPEAFEDQRELQGYSLQLAAEVLNEAAQKLSWNIDTLVEGGLPLNRHKDWHYWERDNLGTPVVVLNSHAWPVRSYVRLNRRVRGATDDTGNPLPLQPVRAARSIKNDETDYLMPVDLPALGWRLHWVYLDVEKPAPPPAFPAAVTSGARVVLDNGVLRVEIDLETGGLAQLTDLRSGAALLRRIGALGLVMDESHCDTWSHDVLVFDRAAGSFGKAQWAVLDQGPLRVRVRTTSIFGASVLRQDFILHAGSDRLEVSARIDWREHHRMLKLAFPLALGDPRSTWEIPFGHLERPVNGEEEPGQLWVDVSGTTPLGQPLGLALLSPELCSHSVHPTPDAAELRMTVVRSPIYADHWGTRDLQSEYMDQGIHDFRYALVPHAGDWRAAHVPRHAQEFAVEPVRVIETYHAGKLPRCFEGLTVSNPNVQVDAVKRSQDGLATIVRCHETAGAEATGTITGPSGGPTRGRSWSTNFRAGEIQTWRLSDDLDLPPLRCDLLERSL